MLHTHTLFLSLTSQVTGELSSGGRPMRAFVQTFVLAPETPKKYYVHNDIFRYQDEDIVSESETNEAPGTLKVCVCVYGWDFLFPLTWQFLASMTTSWVGKGRQVNGY